MGDHLTNLRRLAGPQAGLGKCFPKAVLQARLGASGAQRPLRDPSASALLEIDQNQGQVEDTGEKFRTISSKNAWKPDEGVHIPITH